jgi:deoxyribose-phosphate aldolase
MGEGTVRGFTYEQVAGTIDHSLLRPELTAAEVEAGCALAERYRVASVCCRSVDVPLVVPLLAGGPVAVGTVVGFPHGASPTEVKAHEARLVRSQGAAEIDMVADIGWLRSGELGRVEEEVRQVVAAAGGAVVKVILENAYLSDEQKVAACKAAEAAGADYVKTSTGFAPSGATVEDIRLMRASVSPRVKVKAAHGVRTLDALLDVMEAGAERCGATATATILDDFRSRAGA